MSELFFSLESTKPKINTSAGSLTCITSKETPGLINISFANLKLKKRGCLEPIWHANANKIGYCIEGDVLVSIRTPSHPELFTVKKGEIFFIPQGYVHHIENLGEKESVISFALDHAFPETMYLSKSIYSISDNVFNSTFHTETDFVKGLKKEKQEEVISRC